MKPRIFISAVTSELTEVRQIAANKLVQLGYDVEWQSIFGTDGGDLRQMLRDRIDQCDGLVQFVGFAYGAEPPEIDCQYGRVSYTQFELLYAEEQRKKTWILIATEEYPPDRPLDELDLPPAHLLANQPSIQEESYQAERPELQRKWRSTLQSRSRIWYPAASNVEFALRLHELNVEIGTLRRSFKT